MLQYRSELVAICRQDGVIQELLQDQCGSLAPGDDLTSLASKGTETEIQKLIDAILESGAALNRRIDVKCKGGITPLFLSACATKRGIFVIGTGNPSSPQHLRSEFAQTNVTKADESSNRPVNGHTKPTKITIACGDQQLGRSDEESHATLQTTSRQTDPQDDRFENFLNLSMAVHGLRNPASGIVTAAEYLIQDEGQGFTGKQLELLEGINRSASMMLQMIEEIMEISKIKCGKLNLNRQPADLASLVKLALIVNKPVAVRKRITLDVSMDRETFVADVDGLKISQVIDNLIQNAIKFSPPGSRVEIKVGVRGNLASISVRDYGAGVSEDRITAIFEPFNSGERASGSGTSGMGLGLAISHQIVAAHGGTMAVESEIGKGSTFTIILPAVADGSDGGARPCKEPGKIGSKDRSFAMSA